MVTLRGGLNEATGRGVDKDHPLAGAGRGRSKLTNNMARNNNIGNGDHDHPLPRRWEGERLLSVYQGNPHRRRREETHGRGRVHGHNSGASTEGMTVDLRHGQETLDIKTQRT